MPSGPGAKSTAKLSLLEDCDAMGEPVELVDDARTCRGLAIAEGREDRLFLMRPPPVDFKACWWEEEEEEEEGGREEGQAKD